MYQEIIVAIILTVTAVWLARKGLRYIHGKSESPCESCTTPCKLKDEIALNKKNIRKKCPSDKENRAKN